MKQRNDRVKSAKPVVLIYWRDNHRFDDVVNLQSYFQTFSCLASPKMGQVSLLMQVPHRIDTITKFPLLHSFNSIRKSCQLWNLQVWARMRELEYVPTERTCWACVTVLADRTGAVDVEVPKVTASKGVVFCGVVAYGQFVAGFDVGTSSDSELFAVRVPS